MINFRFHLISLVAVFLALGVGVAMGASFVDRATVDSLRGRVDALDESYRRRGAELDATRAQLGDSDTQAAALAGQGSAAIDDRLSGQPVVLVATDAVSGDVLGATRTSLGASGSDLAGTARLSASLATLRGDDLSRARERFGLRGDSATVRERLAGELGIALSILSAAPDEGGSTTTTTTTTATSTSTTLAAGGSNVVGVPTDAAQARAFVGAMVDLGFVAVDGDGSTADQLFPAGSGYRYVLVGGADESADKVVVPLATAEATRSPMTMTVAESRSARASGEATTTTEDQPQRGTLLAELRSGDVAESLSTVDDLEEAFGRIAVVYAIAEQRDPGRVGHYGTGAGASAPFPTVPAS